MAGVFTMVSDGSVHWMRLPAAGLVVLLAGVPDVSDAALQNATVGNQHSKDPCHHDMRPVTLVWPSHHVLSCVQYCEDWLVIQTCLLLPLPPELAVAPRRRRDAPDVVPSLPADAPVSPDVALTPLPPADALPPEAALVSSLLTFGSLALPSVESGMVQVPVVKVMLIPGPAHQLYRQ
jgi:hypothetical protein